MSVLLIPPRGGACAAVNKSEHVVKPGVREKYEFDISVFAIVNPVSLERQSVFLPIG